MSLASYHCSTPGHFNFGLRICDCGFKCISIQNPQSKIHNYFFPLPPLCPLKTRVGENSPSLWPTMSSVMYTFMNMRPL